MQESRLIPFTVAGVICFTAAFILGAGFWYFFGTKAPSFGGGSNTIVQTSNQNQVTNTTAESNVAPEENTNRNDVGAPAVNSTPEPIKSAPAGEAEVTGGEVTLGGGNTDLPLRRISVSDFAIGETEVTNSQYAEFVEAVGRRAPSSWKDGRFEPGTDDYPVGGVTWSDANAYCEWLSKELGATVRLPSEAEWERAARGDNANNKFPWGNQWDDAAAQGGETKGKVFAVKNAPAGRSPFGAYGMVGNVWEWTSDLSVDQFGKPIFRERLRQRVIKGGSVRDILKEEDRDKFMNVDARLDRPEKVGSELLGFRYVVIRQQ